VIDGIFGGDLSSYAFDVCLGDCKRHIWLASCVRKIEGTNVASEGIERNPHVSVHARRNDAADGTVITLFARHSPVGFLRIRIPRFFRKKRP
jgi:hypothetical protein